METQIRKPSHGMQWVEIGAQAALIVLAGYFVFSPAIHGGWLWDDNRYVAQNPALRSAGGLKAIWLAPPGVNYFPITSTVQWMQWHLWGSATPGYHLTNLGLHLLSCFLIWLLLRRLGVRLAWLGGLLFAVHPLAVESVAWISELKNTLSLPLLLGAMIAYLEFDGATQGLESKTRRGGCYLLCLALFLAAMLSKSTVAMFPAVLLLYCWWKRGRVSRTDLLASIPFFIVSLGLGLVTVWFEHHRAIDASAVPAGSVLGRVACAGLAVAFYFYQWVFPAALLPIYPRWSVDPPSLAQFLPWLVLVAVFWGCWAQRATWGRHALFGLGFFLLNLVPVLGFIPMAYLDISWVADHFAYLPMVGLVGLAAAALSWSFGSQKRQDSAPAETSLPPPRRSRSILLTFGFAAICALLAIKGRSYAGRFLSQETLWTYTVERNPQAWLAQNNVAVVLAAQGRPDQAIAHYEAALRIRPNYIPASILIWAWRFSWRAGTRRPSSD